MARSMNKLTALRVNREAKVGWHGDGGGLWLQVTKTGSRSWVFRYTKDGKAKVLGLGPTHTINLAEAREKARKLSGILEGIPGQVRRRLPDLPASEIEAITREVAKARNLCAAIRLDDLDQQADDDLHQI